MIDFIDKTPDRNGTPLNRANLMGIQGFVAKNTVFEENQIIETNANGDKLTIIFNSDGSITERFVGEKTIIKTTKFEANGTIIEKTEGLS